jgi:1,4-alpha-glucan branching enzyme
MLGFVQTLNKFYLEHSELWQVDYSWEGFKWISNDDNTQSIIAFRRIDKSGKELIAVCNFVPVERNGYRIGVPVAGSYKRVFCTDDVAFGGGTQPRRAGYKAQKNSMHGYDYSVEVDIPAMSVSFFAVPEKKQPSEKNIKDSTATKKLKKIKHINTK